MAILRHIVFIFITLDYSCFNIAKSVSKMCSTNEFLQAETGNCVTCTICDIKLELVTWIPCSNDSDTICGPQLNLANPPKSRTNSANHHDDIVLNDSGRSKILNKWKTIENILTGVLIGVGLTCKLVVLTVCVLRRRKRRDTQWRKLTLFPDKIRRNDDVRTIQELAEDREIIIKNHENIYVKTEDILTSKRPLQSHV